MSTPRNTANLAEPFRLSNIQWHIVGDPGVPVNSVILYDTRTGRIVKVVR